jgi:hypothetical protein
MPALDLINFRVKIIENMLYNTHPPPSFFKKNFYNFD